MNKQDNQKTYFIYENQRWWLGKGWLNYMLPNGKIIINIKEFRYSDINNSIELFPNKFNLVDENEWIWINNWEVEWDQDSDEFGW